MCFFKPEAITWREAQSLSKKPREWKDDVSFIWKRQAAVTSSGPVTKKPKSSNTVTGR